MCVRGIGVTGNLPFDTMAECCEDESTEFQQNTCAFMDKCIYDTPTESEPRPSKAPPTT